MVVLGSTESKKIGTVLSIYLGVDNVDGWAIMRGVGSWRFELFFLPLGRELYLIDKLADRVDLPEYLSR